MRLSPSRYIKREELAPIIETVLNLLRGRAARSGGKIESALGKFTTILVGAFS